MKNLLILFFLIFSLQSTHAQKRNTAALQDLYDEIKDEGIRHPEFVIAQAIQETGWLNCKKCCLRYNNLFGFYLKNGCKQFESREDCIEYYKDWQDKRYKNWRKKYPKADYYHFLKYVRYATGDKYNNELRPKVNWVKKNLKL